MTITKKILAPALVLALYAGCIKEEDGQPAPRVLPQVSISDVTLDEGDENATFTIDVTLTGTNQTNAVVTLVTQAGTAETNADFKVVGGGQLVFAPNETKKTLAITVIGDEFREGDETFTLTLLNAVNAEVGQTTATITIRDDDGNTDLVIPTTGYNTPTTYPGKQLVWSDEFESDSLDLTSWTHEIGDGCPNNCGWGNDELEYYRPDNTFMRDGNLVIEARRQSFGGRDYTSSRIVTKGKRQFKYGRIDIRAVLPEGQGIWPALWMLGANIDAVGWPATGEIDIMELTGDQPGRVLGTVHYGSSVAQHQYTGSSKFLAGGDKFSREYHVFSLDWQQDKIEFLVDDEIFFTVTPASLNGQPYPFNKNFFFIFNVAVGGELPGPPNANTPFPQRMIVDFVRVFQ
jgi:beta-glucanase (GH16 family)